MTLSKDDGGVFGQKKQMSLVSRGESHVTDHVMFHMCMNAKLERERTLLGTVQSNSTPLQGRPVAPRPHRAGGNRRGSPSQ